MQGQTHLLPQGARDFPGWQPLQHWETLTSGDLVEVRSGGTILYYAHVDDLTEDGTIVWLVEYGTVTRRLFLRDDKVTLFTPKTERGRSGGLSKSSD